MELHYRYWIGILIALLIGALTVHWAEIKDLAQLLSFGLSLTSLVLAVIAIFQALFSNSALGQVGTSVTTAAEQVRSAAKEIETASNSLVRHAEQIPPALGEMTTRFQTVEERLLKSAHTNLPPTGTASDNVTSTQLRNTSFGVGFAYYVAVKAFQTGKPFKTSDLVPSEAAGNYLEGSLMTLNAVGLIRLHRKKDGEMTILLIDGVDQKAVEEWAASKTSDNLRSEAFFDPVNMFFSDTAEPEEAGKEDKEG